MSKSFESGGALLLRLRRQREDVARQGLSAAQHDVSEIRGRVSALDRALAAQNAAARQAVAEGGEMVDLGSYRRGVSAISAKMAEEASLLPAAEERLASVQAELLQSVEDRQAAEYLCERLAARRAAKARREAVNESDDGQTTHAAFLAGTAGAEAPFVARPPAQGEL